MREIDWISFDHTVPVPVLRDDFLISRDDIRVLFTEPENEIRWEKTGAWIQWVADGEEFDYDEAERLEIVEVEGVEFFRFTSAPYQFNHDTEQMLELGYTAFFVPGGGIVVNNPDTPYEVAADRLCREIYESFGRFIPQHLNSWAEYASQVPNLDRVYAFIGVERHELQKKALVADLVAEWLDSRDRKLDGEGTVKAKELAVGDVLEAGDVRWWSWSPARVLYTVARIEQKDSYLTVTFTSENDRTRTLTVPPTRRFQKVSGE